LNQAVFFQSPLILRSMPRRWGSYNSTGRVLLNSDLIRAPVPCIDYVITHELVHIVHRNHGPNSTNCSKRWCLIGSAARQGLSRFSP